MTTTWVPVPDGSDFPVQNLPYGVYSRGDQAARVGVAIGDFVLDLAAVLEDSVFAQPSLNAFLAQGRVRWTEVRRRLTELLTGKGAPSSGRAAPDPARRRATAPAVDVADYVDFYSSEHHATNVGRIFRPGGAPLTPNWRHLPIGYHGRAGTMVVSGTPIVRPSGQRKAPDDPAPAYGPSTRLDIEAEVGFVVGTPSELGTRVTPSELARRNSVRDRAGQGLGSM